MLPFTRVHFIKTVQNMQFKGLRVMKIVYNYLFAKNGEGGPQPVYNDFSGIQAIA